MAAGCCSVSQRCYSFKVSRIHLDLERRCVADQPWTGTPPLLLRLQRSSMRQLPRPLSLASCLGPVNANTNANHLPCSVFPSSASGLSCSRRLECQLRLHSARARSERSPEQRRWFQPSRRPVLGLLRWYRNRAQTGCKWIPSSRGKKGKCIFIFFSFLLSFSPSKDNSLN